MTGQQWTAALRNLGIACALATASAIGHALPFGSNLIVNGGAEADVASAGGFDIIRPITGWTPTGNFTIVQYGAPDFPGSAPTLANPPGSGANFFAGGPSNASSNAMQSIDVSSGAAAIDLGGVVFALEGYLGGWDSQGDNAVLSIRFLDATSTQLGAASIGPVTPTDRGGVRGLLYRNDSGVVPIGTREIEVLLQMTRLAGAYNDGYADNLSLVLRNPTPGAPIPSTVLLLGLGLAALAHFTPRRQRHATQA